MKTLSTILFAILCFTPVVVQAQQVETEIEGVKAELLELRQAGGVLRLAVRFINEGAERAEVGRFEAGRIALVDAKTKKKHLPLKDANGDWVAGPIADDIDGGRIAFRIPSKQSAVVWAYFEPLTPGSTMNVEVPNVFPFEKVPVTEGPGKVFSNAAAPTTPHGGVATIVAAKREDQVLNVRVRLAAEKGQEVQLLDAYMRYKHVFLFDPAGKRKYPLLKATDGGDFQGTPLTVPGDGGSFVYDWRKTTLVSLAFQAPPDSVHQVDLLMPQFLPVEAMKIDGLGGAAEGGIETAGKSLGLEGALKELKAEVTPTEIKIALAADVLFDFDKAEIKNRRSRRCRTLPPCSRAIPAPRWRSTVTPTAAARTITTRSCRRHARRA